MHSKIFIETFGCSFNQASSEIIQGILEQNNYQLIPSIEASDIIILNTCIVKTNTEARILNKIETYSKKFPNKGLLITGCMPEVLAEKIFQINPKISILGPHYVTDVLTAVQSLQRGKQFIRIGHRKEPKLCLPRRIENPVIAKIQIAQGCLNNCTYCITKHAMGKLHSYSIEEIIKEIEIDLKRGCKEIWLTAQDTGCYGFDINTSLPDLLNQIIQIPYDFRVRIGMMNPKSLRAIYEQLISFFNQPKIYKFIHVPIQSGNEEILKKMNRQYSISEILKILMKFRKEIPHLTISLDIIVGFPSETDEQFMDTISVVKQIQPDIVNISKFGARPKTPAARMKAVPTKIVKARSSVLTKVCNELSLARNKAYVAQNTKQQVLTILYGKKGGVIARTNNYKPVILNESCNLGTFSLVKLTEASQNYLKGKILNSPLQ
ncbi:MAG: tRNA (N(6)-L-threonylcarbamoyladenosine(37)-C(2))-methylthiotransferase [Candidatus Helarchaeota archaeon]